MSINLNLKQILFQSQVRARPLRENFTALETAANDIQNQINSVLTSALPDGTEVVNARDYHTVLRERLRSTSKATGNKLISGGIVTQNVGDTTKIDITAGEAVVAGVGCKWDASTSGSISVCAANKHRVDVVYIDSSNALGILTGSEVSDTNTNPVFPIPSSTQLSIACYYVDDASVWNNDDKVMALSEDNEFPNVCLAVETVTIGEHFFNNLFVPYTASPVIRLKNSETAPYNTVKKYHKFLCTGNVHTGSQLLVDGIVSPGSAGHGFNGESTTPVPSEGGVKGLKKLIAPIVATQLPDVMNSYQLVIGGGSYAFTDLYNNHIALSGVAGRGANSISSLGFGGGGGATWWANGGDGGKNSGASNANLHDAFSAEAKPALIIIAKNIVQNGDIVNIGQETSEDPNVGTGGNGGGGGGMAVLIARNEYSNVNNTACNCRGGDGTAAKSGSPQGSGGGGGGGGLVYVSAPTINDLPTANVSGGAGGLGAANGSVGEDGLFFYSESPIEADIYGFYSL